MSIASIVFLAIGFILWLACMFLHYPRVKPSRQRVRIIPGRPSYLNKNTLTP